MSLKFPGGNMFILTATRNSSKFEQSFTNWIDANAKAKWLAEAGFDALITPTRVPKQD